MFVALSEDEYLALVEAVEALKQIADSDSGTAGEIAERAITPFDFGEQA